MFCVRTPASTACSLAIAVAARAAAVHDLAPQHASPRVVEWARSAATSALPARDGGDGADRRDRILLFERIS
jgi:hypothetical protein